MKYSPVFFYDDNAGDNGGGGNDSNTDQHQQKVDTTVQVKSFLTSENIKEYGFDSEEQANDFLRQRKENIIPEEERKRAADVEKANLIKYSTETNIMGVDEFTQYESLSKKADRDLVFEKYATEQKEDDPDLRDEDIREQFEQDYKLNSDNPKAKLRGEARIAKEAKDMKSPLESKYTSAKKGYEEAVTMKNEIPNFNKFVDELITELTPDKLNIAKVKDGDAEIEIPVELTKAERDELATAFKTSKTFAKFLDSKGKAKETLAPVLKNKITSFLKVKHFDAVAGKSFELGKGIGLKNGSNNGSENLFGLNQQSGKDNGTGGVDQEKEIRESHKRISAKYPKN